MAKRPGASIESGQSQAGPGKGGGGDKEQGENDLFKINGVYFRALPSLSLVSKRTLLVNQSQKTSYSGTNDTIIYQFNTGEYYISPSSSYLYIQCGYNNPTKYGLSKAVIPQGNIISMFEEVVFTTASGTEIERQLNKGFHHAITFRYQNTQEYIDTIGQMQGAPMGKYFMIHDGVAPIRGTSAASGATSTRFAYNLASMYPALGGYDGLVLPRSGEAAKSYFGYGCTNLNIGAYSAVVKSEEGKQGDTAVTAWSNATLPEFIVPLDQILGMFKPYMNVLFPAGALAGGRLEIRLKNALEALQFMHSKDPEDTSNTFLAALVADANTAFTINKTYLVLDAFQLQDLVLKKLNQVAAGQDGLTVMYDTYDHTTTPFAGAGAVEPQVSQARSRVVRAFNAVRDTQAILCPYINSLSTEAAIFRSCAKMPPASLIASTAIPTDLSGGESGSGGGLTFVTLVQNSSTNTNNDPTEQTLGTTTVVGSAPVTSVTITPSGKLGLLELIPPLPEDTYGQPASGSGNGGPAGTANYGQPTVSSFQAQLGSLFFPQQPMTTPMEHYYNAMYTMCKGVPDPTNTCSVTREDFYGGLGYNWWNPANSGSYTDPTKDSSWRNWVAPYGIAIYGFLAEKSQALNLSGLPLANARLLRFKMTFAKASASGNRTISTFTQYTKMFKTFLGGRVVVRE